MLSRAHKQLSPPTAVAGPHCTLSYVSDRATIGCGLAGRVLVIRPDEPPGEKAAVCLQGIDPVSTYDYTQPSEWWRIDEDTHGRGGRSIDA